jgi:outer membrane protein assembly factor BamB
LGDGSFDDFDDRQAFPTLVDARQVLLQVPGQPYELSQERRSELPIVRMSGVFRLNLPWPPESALRFSLLEPDSLQVHIWCGERGITLRYYKDFQQTWAAYAVVRESGKWQPAEQVLLATSEDRYRRSGLGTVELQCRDGNLVMVRGDLEILTVPMEGPVSEVDFQGKGLLRGVEIGPSKRKSAADASRAEKLPNPNKTGTVAPADSNSGRVSGEHREPVPVLLDNKGKDKTGTVAPADLEWEMKPRETKPPAVIALNKLPEGGVELVAGPGAPAGQAAVSLHKPRMREFLFEVEGAEPGTGVFLGDAEGRHLGRLAFVRHRESGKMAFELAHQWASETEKSYDIARQPVALCGRRQWFRMLCGAGVVKCYTAADAIHWSQATPVDVPCDGACSQIGLYCLPGAKQRSITLRSMVVRPLDAFAAIEPEGICKCAPAMTKIETMDAWQRLVNGTRPEDVSRKAWAQACAVQYLSEGPRTGVAQAILDRLLQSILDGASDANRDAWLRLLDQAALLRQSGDWGAVDRWSDDAQRLGWSLAHTGCPAPFTVVRRAMLRLPYWHGGRRLPAFFETLLRDELSTRVARERWDDVREFCRELRYYGAAGRDGSERLWTTATDDMLRWADALAASELPATAEKPAPVEKPARKSGPRRRGRPLNAALVARHPLAEHLSKETYNAVVEFHAALDAQSYREACQIVLGLSTADLLGVLPDDNDRRLLVSFPLAVASAMRERPALRETLEEKFAALGKLRLKNAATAGDSAAMESVAMQFAGTDVSSQALRCLGDRALSLGQFDEAADRFHKALACAAAADRDGLLARLRLVGSLLGQDAGPPVKTPVSLGESSFTPDEFEKMVLQLRQNRAAANESGQREAAEQGRLLAPGRYKTKSWARLEGRGVKHPSGVPDRGIDWAGQQVSALALGNLLFLNNGIEQTALDLSSGRQRWNQWTAVADDRQGWPQAPMRASIVGDRIFVRRLSNDGPELICLETGEGKIVWRARPDAFVASDPFFVDSKLFVLTVGIDGVGKLALHLVGLASGSGRVRSHTLLAEFHDVWRQRIPCQVAVAGSQIVVAASGCVLACDPSGGVHWVRRQIWIPAADPDYSTDYYLRWLERLEQPPLVADGKVYATQPGVWGVECIDLETGRLVWRRNLGDLFGVIGRTPGQVIVQTRSALLSLASETGQTVWRHPVTSCLNATLCDSSHALLYARAGVKKDAASLVPVVLSWLDIATGRLEGVFSLDTPPHQEPWFRPIATTGQRAWGFFATTPDQATREIFELERTGDLEAGEE